MEILFLCTGNQNYDTVALELQTVVVKESKNVILATSHQCHLVDNQTMRKVLGMKTAK